MAGGAGERGGGVSQMKLGEGAAMSDGALGCSCSTQAARGGRGGVGGRATGSPKKSKARMCRSVYGGTGSLNRSRVDTSNGCPFALSDMYINSPGGGTLLSIRR